ncbi:MAG: hypothetical protein ACHQYP_12495 [Nitrospiria bacterium]
MVFLIFFFLFLFFPIGEVKILYAYTEIPVEKGGELSGTITFNGEPPINQVTKVVLNPEYCGNTVYDETYVVNSQNKGLGNVVVSIEEIEKGKKADDKLIILENLKCHFVPHVQAGMVGNYFEIRNLDPVLHNNHVRINGRTILNMATPPNGTNVKKKLSDPGIINTACDLHTFMKGAIFVSKNPYFAVTDKDGNYTISNIPPGKYQVKIWHEALPSQEKEIVISPRKKINLSMELGK